MCKWSLALGVSFVIFTGGIDISVGTVMTFSSVMSGIALNNWGLPLPLVILFGFLVGAFCGAVNGFGVAKMYLPPFIATMAMQMITKGLSLVVSGIKHIFYCCTGLSKYSYRILLGIPGFYNAIVILLVIAVIAYIIFLKQLSEDLPLL